MSRSPEALRRRAQDLYDRQRPNRGKRNSPPGHVIAQIPLAPGVVLGVEMRDADETYRSGMVSFRTWGVAPDGTLWPKPGGFTIGAGLLPNLAHAIADALERELDALPTWAEPVDR